MRSLPLSFSRSRLLFLTLLALAVLLAWDATGWDLPLAEVFGTPYGFPWRHHWFFVSVAHEAARFLSWALLAALWLAVPWPVGVLRRLTRIERLQLALTVLASVAAVSLLKAGSSTSCPWDLKVFGGTASYVSHWAWGVHDGGGGRCFPAGHASAAFAYLGVYFAFRRSAPRLACMLLAVAFGVGLLLGLAQQVRGAHYMSHTLWTAWMCWTVALCIDGLRRWRLPLSTARVARHARS